MNRLLKRKARRLARYAWVSSGGDKEKAEEIFKASPDLSKLDPATILAILQIALLLWKWWNETNKTFPGAAPEIGEPVDYESDE